MLTLFVLIFSICASAAPSAPQPMPGGIYTGGILRVFAANERVAWMGEFAAANESADRKPKEFTLGWYYSLTPNWKVGGFVRDAHGLRHDEDWRSENGAWSWNNSNGREEIIFIGDVTGKAEVPFSFARNWVVEFKTRYLYNGFNDNRTLLLRPGLNYFWMTEGRLLANLFVQLEVDFPLNYGPQTISEKWIYLGSLFHAHENIDIGPFAAISWQTWGRPQAYADKGGGIYSITTQSTTLGLIVLLTL